MMFDVPIQSARKDNQKGGRVTTVISLVLPAAGIAPSSHRATFTPGTLNGHPVPVDYNFTVNLRIE